jgi:hypothetical protein
MRRFAECIATGELHATAYCRASFLQSIDVLPCVYGRGIYHESPAFFVGRGDILRMKR